MVKMLSFLVWTIVHHCLLIIEKIYPSFGKVPTDRLNEITITAKAKYSVE